MDAASAELTKYAANAMLATRISFMNEIANLCDSVGADVDAGARGHRHGRAHRLPFLFPGVGYGGSCFPKDVKALVRTARGRGLRAAGSWTPSRRSTSAQKQLLVAADRDALRRRSRARRIAVWGLAFKPRHRRHARGAGASRDRGPARRRARRCAPTTPRRCDAARKRCSATASTLRRRAELRRGRGRRRAGPRHRVERVPRARLRRASRPLMRHAGRSSTAATSRARRRCASWASTTTASAAVEGSLVTGGAGYIGSHAVRELRDAGHDVVVLDDLVDGPPRGGAEACRSCEGDLADRAAPAAARWSGASTRSCTSPACCYVGESVTRPGEVLPRQRRRGA